MTPGRLWRIGIIEQRVILADKVINHRAAEGSPPQLNFAGPLYRACLVPAGGDVLCGAEFGRLMAHLKWAAPSNHLDVTYKLERVNLRERLCQIAIDLLAE